ncbi:hypothetical protein GG804_25135 [Sphingomonas histidinilytica]|uniref:hypothetical protein n=1 Tax=Rhizorhabdus histidinilytica TaxID=439228 RepID=UPI001ADA2E5F|nr:hypothetical protein [Rhizorhabdus histidinilytica]MBO9380057.1 hypothetical protein [Rhizorhabdus histidinilytica]
MNITPGAIYRSRKYGNRSAIVRGVQDGHVLYDMHSKGDEPEVTRHHYSPLALFRERYA